MIRAELLLHDPNRPEIKSLPLVEPPCVLEEEPGRAIATRGTGPKIVPGWPGSFPRCFERQIKLANTYKVGKASAVVGLDSREGLSN